MFLQNKELERYNRGVKDSKFQGSATACYGCFVLIFAF